MNLTDGLQSLLMDRQMKEKIEFFRKVSIFDGLKKYDVGKLITAMYHRTYESGDIICPEGEIGKALFIIREGAVAISRKAGLLSGEKIISSLKSGDFFGEMALLEEKPRSATAKAVAKSEIYIIYKSNFDSMIEKDPKIGLQVIRNIAKILSSRLRGMMDQIS